MNQYEAIHEQFEVTNGRGETLRGDLRRPDVPEPVPVIVFCHGYRSFKDHLFFPYLALKLARRGYGAVTFNLSGSGIGADLQSFSELPRLESSTISQDLEDLSCVLEAIGDGKVGRGRLDADQIAVVGHGKGGAICLLAGAEEDRVKVVGTLATVSRLDAFGDEERRRWRKEGYLAYFDESLGREIRLQETMLDDLEQNAERFDLVRAVENLGKPLILMHGEEDHACEASESERLYHRADKDLTRLVIFEKTGHNFGVSHPFVESNKEVERIIQILDAFIQQSFAGQLPKDL
ncbi:MAG: alpha/beta fold hydrolase [Planctomycetota bacterium]